MYLIVSYDVEASRCNKIKKIMRLYFFHIHNSVFEGEISEADFKELKNKLDKYLDHVNDKLLFYILPSSKCLKKESINNLSDINNII